MSTIQQLKRLGGQSLIYGLSGIISRFLYVFLVPIYTRIFLPEDYAVIAVVTNLSVLLLILSILSLDNSVGRWYFDAADEKDQKVSLNTFLWTIFTVAAIFGFCILLFNRFIATELLDEPRAREPLVVLAITLPLSVFQSFSWNILRMQHRAVMTVVFSIVTSVVTLSLSVLFVAVLKLGVIGVFYAQLCSAVVATVWTLYLFRKFISVRYFNWNRLKEMFRFSFPLLPGSIAFWVVNLSAAYFLQFMGDSRDVGLYQVGSTIATVIVMLTGAFQMAWGPFAYSIHKQDNAKLVYAQVFQIFSAVVCCASLLLTLYSREILEIFTTEIYSEAYLVVSILAFNHFFISLSYIASIGTGIAKNNKAYGYSMIAAATLLVILNLILIPIYGKEGAAFSVVVSQIVVPVAVFWHAQKLYPIPYAFGRVILTAGFSIILGFGTIIALNKTSFTTTETVLLKLIPMMIFFGIIYKLNHREVRNMLQPTASLNPKFQ